MAGCFCNHSKDPNATISWTLVSAEDAPLHALVPTIVSLRRIEAGEFIMLDYGINYNMQLGFGLATSCHILDLFFVSQALKQTTATTQLLTDMENPIYKEMGVGPQLVPVVCIDTTGGPFVKGKSQEACVLYGTTCADRNLKTPTT